MGGRGCVLDLFLSFGPSSLCLARHTLEMTVIVVYVSFSHLLSVSVWKGKIKRSDSVLVECKYNYITTTQSCIGGRSKAKEEMNARPVHPQTWVEHTKRGWFIGWTWQHAPVRLSF